jgi:hypothetical protein
VSGLLGSVVPSYDGGGEGGWKNWLSCGHVEGGEGGELEVRCGHGTKRSELPAASPNRRAREGEQEWEMGAGVGSVPCGVRKMGEREREGPRHGGRQRGPRGRDGSRRHGQRRQRALVAKVG